MTQVTFSKNKADSRGATSSPAWKIGRRVPRTVLLLILLLTFLPPTAALYFGSFKLSAGRFLLLLVLLPAIRRLFEKSRSAVSADFFVGAGALCILAASIATDGFNPTAISEAFEFAGFYILGRAFLYGIDSIRVFIKILKIILLILVFLGALDVALGHFVINEMIGQLLSTATIASERPYSHFQRVILGYSFLRAASTFDHPILFGSFCSICGAIFLFSELRRLSKIFFFFISAIGGVLAGSSAPLLALALGFFIYVYDKCLSFLSQRWKILLLGIGLLVVLLFALVNRPIAWLILHLTLDPETGYFRLEEWNEGLSFVSLSPWAGYGTTAIFGSDFLDVSLDSVWLVTLLHYGIPATIFILLANVKSLAKSKTSSIDPIVERYCLCFTAVIVLFCFNGLTVHYWNSLWQFWAFCIGARATLGEYRAKHVRPKIIRATKRPTGTSGGGLVPMLPDRGARLANPFLPESDVQS